MRKCTPIKTNITKKLVMKDGHLIEFFAHYVRIIHGCFTADTKEWAMDNVRGE